MTNLVFNLRNAKAQASCAKLNNRTYSSLPFREGAGLGFLGRGFILLLLLTLGVGNAWAYYLYLYTGDFTDWSNDYATFRVGTSGNASGDQLTYVAPNWYRCSTTKTGTQYIKRCSSGDGSTYWNGQFSASISSTNYVVRATGWNSGSVYSQSPMYVAGDQWKNTSNSDVLANWSTTDTKGKLTYDGNVTFSKTFSNVKAGDHEFKVVFYNTWDNATGWGGTITGVNCTTANASGNIKFTQHIDGNVTISYNASTGAITITCPKIPITLNRNGGSANGSATVDVGASTLSSITHVTRSGYSLKGYYTASSGGYKVINYNGNLAAYSSNISAYLNSNGTWKKTTATTLYAQWEPYTLTVSAGSHISTVTGTTSPVTLGSSYAITASGFDTGYEFDNWTADPAANASFASSTSASTNVTVSNGSVTVTANAKEKKSTITVTTATSSQGTLKFGSTSTSWGATASVGVATSQNITATAASGYKFVRWNLSGAAATASSTTSATITLKADGSGNTGTATAVFEEDLTTVWYLYGTLNSWSTTANKFTKRTGESTGSVAYTTISLAANTHYEFGVHNGSDYYSNNNGSSEDYYIKGTIENWTFNKDLGYGVNCHIKTTLAGTYTFKIDFSGSNPLVSVYYPEIYAISGDFNDWTESSNLVFDGNVGTYAVNLTASEDVYEFKVLENGVWCGGDIDITGNVSNQSVTVGGGRNITIKAKVYPSGTYTFTYNKSTHKLSVTYPTSYTVTYNGNSATGGSAPATSYHTPGSNVTLATNTGVLYKDGCAFNGWNTDTGGGGTHYASGGTLTGISDNVTLYAEWKANDNHMYFYNKDNWPAVAAYMWKHIAPSVNDPERTYPGRTMTLHQGKVYKIDYRSDVQDSVVFNNGNTGSGNQTGDIKIADGQSGDHWFYNDADKSVNTGGIHYGWSQYIMVAGFPTSTVAAVVGEKVTITPVLAWAEDISSTDIEITSTRASGSSNVNAVISGSNIIVSGIAKGDAVFTIRYHYVHPTTPAVNYTITKTLNVSIKDGITIQSKVPKNDDHWVYSNCMKVHYWNHGLSDGDITMAWVKEDASYTYYQTFVPLGTDGKIDFLFYYDNFDDAWRKTQDITNVTASGCYTINHGSGLEAQRNAVRAADRCVDTWQVQITMNNGDIFTSNAVGNSTDVISFFAPSNASSDPSYRKGTVTLEHNGATAATLSSPGSPSASFSQSGVYTAKVNTSTGALTNVALYTGNYYIRTDPSHGGWDNYKTDPLNKMTHFNRNPNFSNETFSYYWVDNVAKSPGDPVNIKATVANDYNPVLCGFSADETVTREVDGLNLRFGYEPTTNDLIRGILRGSTTDNFLNVIGTTGNIYRDAACATPMNETTYSEHPDYLKMQDKSNWVYEILAYTIIDGDHGGANVYLKSYFNGIHYLLGMEKDEDGRDTSTPNNLPVIVPGTTHDTYGLRVIYDFKTNRLFAAWAPADRTISSDMNVDADIMFLRHEQDSVAQITFANTTPAPQITGLNKAIFAVEIADDRSTSLGNRELHYFFSLPFDCNVKDIFGIGGFMEYWGIQYYDGAERARIGWFVETPTFWKWLDWNDRLNAGQGYLLSIDKKALQDNDQWKEVNFMDLEGEVWVDKGKKSILTLYFPSAGSGFSMSAATGSAQTITYENQPCSITRDDRDQKDSNWKCIGTPGYKNMKMTGYTATTPAPPVWDNHMPPNFLYEFNEQTSTATYAKGTYTVRNGRTWNYRAFHSYMVQYAGTINWGAFSAGNGPSAIVARRAPQNEMSQATNVEIDLLSEDSTSLDRTFVWLREDATAGYDQNYDLNKMVESYANQIYSLSDHDIPFAANVMPYETDTVRLVVNIVNPGEFTFSMLKDEHFGLTPILYDMYKSERIDLTSADYTVELDYGKYTDRFFLLFSPVKPVATAIETTEDGTQNVLSGEAIYDVLGRRVSTVTPGHLYIVNGEKRIAQ